MEGPTHLGNESSFPSSSPLMDSETPTPVSRGRGRPRVLAALTLVFVVGIIGAWSWRSLRHRTPQSRPGGTVSASTNVAPTDNFDTRLSQEVRDAVDSWIRTNRLNKYGDPEGTMYLGGTPLFDERTGRTLGRYEYILSKHPEFLASTPGGGRGSVNPTNSPPVAVPESVPKSTNSESTRPNSPP